jgi:hypothetical protein
VTPADLKLRERQTLLACNRGQISEDPRNPKRITRRVFKRRTMDEVVGTAGLFPEQHSTQVKALVELDLVARCDDGSYRPTPAGRAVIAQMEAS